MKAERWSRSFESPRGFRPSSVRLHLDLVERETTVELATLALAMRRFLVISWIISCLSFLRSSMSPPPLPFLMIVIDGAGTCAGARADQRTFPATDQRPGSRPYGRTNAYALSGFAFSGLRVPITPALAARNGNRQREREHQQQSQYNS